MSKPKKIFVCTNCGATSPKWVGKCPSCEEWNTYQEEVIVRETPAARRAQAWADPDDRNRTSQPVSIEAIQAGARRRLVTPDEELNRVLGGGIVPGSLVLIGGQPGIGKSTLMLQVAMALPAKVLYVSGEESEEQIKMRADRIGQPAGEVLVLAEINTARILQHAQQLRPDLIVIDSIQTLSSPALDSAPGTVSQVRECAADLQRFAKQTHTPVFLIGHITKEGALAGPKLLEHLVDVVLQFEGDQHYVYRILRTLKNRFGSTDELGIYEMRTTGLRQVPNPSELLLSQTDEALSGSAVAATIEGLRPMLIETQALVSKAIYGTPQRTATGFDLRRLSMLLAVLEKRCGFPMGMHDVFLNMAGGIRVDDPAIDLAIVSAIISSFQDVTIPPDLCFAGEVGLSGEIRAVTRIEQRIQEANRLGFRKIFTSKYSLKGLDLARYQIEVEPVGRIDELYQKLFV